MQSLIRQLRWLENALSGRAKIRTSKYEVFNRVETCFELHMPVDNMVDQQRGLLREFSMGLFSRVSAKCRKVSTYRHSFEAKRYLVEVWTVLVEGHTLRKLV